MYTVDSEIYETETAGQFEYRVTLLDSDGDIVDEWDSAIECANGMQFLTRQDCEDTIETIRQDVANGAACDWFSIPGQPCGVPGMGFEYRNDGA